LGSVLGRRILERTNAFDISNPRRSGEMPLTSVTTSDFLRSEFCCTSRASAAMRPMAACRAYGGNGGGPNLSRVPFQARNVPKWDGPRKAPSPPPGFPKSWVLHSAVPDGTVFLTAAQFNQLAVSAYVHGITRFETGGWRCPMNAPIQSPVRHGAANAQPQRCSLLGSFQFLSTALLGSVQ
jgi:hypothetical protein